MDSAGEHLIAFIICFFILRTESMHILSILTVVANLFVKDQNANFIRVAR